MAVKVQKLSYLPWWDASDRNVKMAFSEMDASLTRAIRNLHSSSNESTNILKNMLDEAIKNKYGPGKEVFTYFNITTIEFPGMSISTSNDISSDLTKEEIKPTSSSDELELEDLTCIICKGMSVGARNKLLECSVCHDLYHQECHSPPISEVESNDNTWSCNNCKDMLMNKTAKKSPVVQEKTVSSVKSSFQKYSTHKESMEFSMGSSINKSPIHLGKSSSSGKSPSGQNRVITPNINIISADKRLQIMKKKAAKMQEKRKLSR